MSLASGDPSRKWRWIALSQSFGHHAKGSGYAEITSHIQYDSIITAPDGYLAKTYNTFVHRSQGSKILRRLTRRRTATEVRYLFRHSFSAPKLVHVLYGEHHSWLLRTMRSGPKSRKIMTVHLPPDLWHVSFKPGQLDRFDAVILMSDNQIEPLRNGLGYQGRVEVIEHGVDLQRFSFAERHAPADTIQCIMVGNFLRDYEALARISQRIQEKKAPIRLVVVASQEAASAVIGVEGIEHHTRLSDARLLELYHASHVGVFTMKDCTANNALLEAMATGLPIVANDVGGMRTYVNDSFCSFAPLDSPDAFIDAIQASVQEPAAYAARCQAARQKAETFGWEVIAERTRQLYREVTA